MIVCALNCGSSSIKAGLFEVDGGVLPLARARLGNEEMKGMGGIEAAVRRIVETLTESLPEGGQVAAVGHRVVHGGSRYTRPLLLAAGELAELAALEELAPLHNGPSLEGIRAARSIFGADVPMVAVFDTAFHAAMPERAWRYAIPTALADRHEARRFGFHGLSYQSVVEAFGSVAGVAGERARIVALHLGSGCSAAAIANGRSVDTSMGLTPLEGLVMGTRSGDVDPALVGHLSRREGVAVEEIEERLNRESGLLGISGLSSDVRVLLEREREHPGARLALEVFCHRARKYVGAYVAALGGADALVFTGGIGEHQPELRARICAGLEAFGIVLDPARNAVAIGTAAKIGADGTRIGVYVIPADEERVIAAEAARLG